MKRILQGNMHNQLGIFDYSARPEYKKELFKFLSDAFDIVKNQNFETYAKVLSKMQPTQLQKSNFGPLLSNDQIKKSVVQVCTVYLDQR